MDQTTALPPQKSARPEMTERGSKMPVNERRQEKHRSHVTRSLLKIGRGLSVIHRAVDSEARDMYDDADDLGSLGDSNDGSGYNSRSEDDSDREDRRGDDRRPSQADKRQGPAQKDNDFYAYSDPQDDDEPLSDDDEAADRRDDKDERQTSDSNQSRPTGRKPIKGQDPSPAKTKLIPEKPATPSTQTPKSSTVSSEAPKAKASIETVAGKSASRTTVPDIKPVKSVSKPNPLAPTAAAPFGYKIVQVKKPDGTIAKVKRPLKEEEAARIAAAKAKDATDKEICNVTAGEAKSVSATVTDAQSSVKSTTAESTSSATNKSTSPVSIQSVSLSGEKKVPSTALEHKTGLIDEKLAARISEKEIADEESQKSTSSPKPARSLVKRTWNFFQILTWSVMIIFPLVFLALALATAILNRHKLSERDSRLFTDDPLTQAITVAASMWPIVFAAVVAQTLKAYAAYRVERGIPLMTLEQLTSSHSVGGAIKQPFMLRSFNWTSVILFILWGLSPLAGQAILRMSRVETIFDTSPFTVQYFQPQNLDQIYRTLEGGDHTALAEVNAMYTSLLVGNDAGQRAPQDTWTNIKIPVYNDSLSRFEAEDGWWYPNENAELGATRYSSLIGIPFWIPDTGYEESNTTFSVETSYYVLNCPDVTPLDVSDEELAILNQTISPGQTLYMSAANSSVDFDGFGQPTDSFTAGFRGTIYFGSRGLSRINGHPFNGSYADLVQSSSCNYDVVNVISEVSCIGSQDFAQCSVLRQKPLATPGKPSQYLGRNFISSMLLMAGPTSSDATTPTLTEKFVYNAGFATNSSSVVWQSTEGRDLPPAFDAARGLANVTGAQLDDNLGLLVNTLWTAGSAHPAFHGGNVDKLSRAGGAFNLTDAADASTTGAPYAVYRVDWPWLAVLVVCSVVLLAAAAASAVWEYFTIGPDFIGFANTALKRNVKLPRNMNALSARERLQALQECEILLQDVRPDADVGKIALGVKENSSRRLIPGRKYR